MLSCLWDWELEWCLYRLLVAVFPATRRQNKKGEGKLKWERAKDSLRRTTPLPLSYCGASKPHFVCEIMSARFLSLATKSVLSDTPGDSLAMPSEYPYSQCLPFLPHDGCSSYLSTQFYSINMLEWGVGPCLEWFGSDRASFQGLPVVTLCYRGKTSWFLESKPLGLNPSSVSKWMSNVRQGINLRWHGRGLWVDYAEEWGALGKEPSLSQVQYPSVPFILSSQTPLVGIYLEPRPSVIW